MAILKFRIYLEEDDAVYRDIVIKHTQYFLDLHFAILKAFEFDTKHQATFYRSNDNWLKGREISFEKYDKAYRVDPLLMAETTIGSEIQDVNQKFIYEYDFAKGWTFLVALISVNKEENPKLIYPSVTRVEGIGPQQMPLPCKILKNYSSSVVVDVVSFGTIPKDTQSRNPHSIGETFEVVWGNLTYADVETIEIALLNSKGTGRFSYEGGEYYLVDTYTIRVTNNKPSVSASFVRVA